MGIPVLTTETKTRVRNVSRKAKEKQWKKQRNLRTEWQATASSDKEGRKKVERAKAKRGRNKGQLITKQSSAI